jgi:hypothetical protein
VHDSLLVGRLERAGDLGRGIQRIVHRHRAALQTRGELVTRDQLHREKTESIVFVETVDPRDVRMVQRCEDLGFPLEPGEPFGILGERRRQELQRHLAIELRIARAPHLAHGSRPQGGDDLVGAEAGAGGDVHRGIIRSDVGPAWKKPRLAILNSRGGTRSPPIRPAKKGPATWRRSACFERDDDR